MEIKSNIFMGIDVSKVSLDISVDGKHYKVNNSKAGIKVLIEKIKEVKIELCALESTGGYERLAIMILTEAGIRVVRCHPNKVYAFAKVSNHFAKTDKLDAKLLEKYAGFIAKENIVEVVINDKQCEIQELRSLQRDLEMSLHGYQCREDHLSGKALEYVRKHIEFVKKQLEAIGTDIEEVISTDKDLKDKQKILISYKGVGKKVANSILAELPELGKLSNKEIASLVGVAPKTNESGKKVFKAHIKGGRFYLRKALYMSALVAARYNDKMKAFYERLTSAGKAKNIALVAIMRKIIVCLNAMVRNNQLYLNI